jgi:hypothetical protein
MRGLTLAQANQLKLGNINPVKLAIADWHYGKATEAYAQYQAKLEEAERETKHNRYLRGVAYAEVYLPTYQRHTIIADGLLR